MTEIRNGKFERNDVSKNSMGGTEILTKTISERVDNSLLQEFQIVASRKRELQADKIRIFYAHDLIGDPESEFLKDSNNHDLFHRYVFVSNWQMQQYINYYKLPWSKCIVLKNAIDAIESHKKPTDVTRFIYTPTPHRGLNILVPVFDALTKKHDNIHLDVYSSFELYGWSERDKPYQELFDQIKNHPKMTYHGTRPNEEIREAIRQSHIFAYPSTWLETSCLCLMEAMSGGLYSIHPNYGALYETAADVTSMYQYQDDLNHHASLLYSNCDRVLQFKESNPKMFEQATLFGKQHIDAFHTWETRIPQWEGFLQGLLELNPDRSLPTQTFRYSTT